MAFPFRDSYSDSQLKSGVYDTEPSTKLKENCKYSVYNQDISDVYNIQLKGLDPDLTAFPCGLITKYFPTDAF